MSFGLRIRDAEAVLHAYRETVAPALAPLDAMDDEVRMQDGALSFERIRTPHKCILRVAIVPFHPEEGAHADVTLSPYRVVTGRARREMATILLRGKPSDDGMMHWTPWVERHTNLTPPAIQLVRRFQAVGRMKGLDSREMAAERLRLLVGYVLRGPKSLA
jgi:hypothetical protein